jgi:tRNA A-37 threonylcarbamoyl transferase component Bud32
MTSAKAGHTRVVMDGWRLWVAAGWERHARELVGAAGAAGPWPHRSKHARTRRISLCGAPAVYIKRYHRYRWSDLLKGLARPSRTERASTMSQALQRAGFDAPRVVLWGHRMARLTGEELLVTEEIAAPEVRDVIAATAPERSPAAKRSFLRRLGQCVARLHEAGFCHGDLVPTNLRVRGDAANPGFVFLDNDRTRRRRRPVSLRRSARNLVQLNRFVVPALTATDRWRVFRAYADARRLARGARRDLARRVILKTVERRRRFDGIDAADRMSFRMLMRPGA